LQEFFSQFELGTEPLWPLAVQEDRSTAQQLFAKILLVGVGFGVLCGGGRFLAQSNHHIFTFCAANGVLVAFLLRRTRDYWWIYLLAAWLGDAISMGVGVDFSQALAASLAFCNVLEVAIAAVLMRRALARNSDMAAPIVMIQFLLSAVILAPAVSGMLGALCCHLANGQSIWMGFEHWYPPYALGMAVMVPFALAMRDPNLKELFSPPRLMRNLGVFLWILLLSIVVFQETRFSLLFLLVPFLMVAVFQVRILGTAIVAFEVVFVGTLYTLSGQGPFWVGGNTTMRSSILLLQSASLLVALWMMPFAATMERQRRLRKGLREQMQRYQLLADNSRDIVVMANLQGRRLYVSPAVSDVLGWTQEEWVDQEAIDFMHREDVEHFRSVLQEIVQGSERTTIRYRTRHKKGEYIWMEANVRALPDQATGKPAGLVANIRDISERVESELKLAEAHENLQQQAQRDSLTQLANRRCFDETLEKEWRRGRRTGHPIALLMVDIDNFKFVNDTFGHRVGDHCLQLLSATLRRSAKRPGDLVARYGGEEFAVLLPDVDLSTATVMADMLCLRVREQMFEVGGGTTLPLTVSVGVAALVPDKSVRGDALIEAADRALYAAKQSGRDRVMSTFQEELTSGLLFPVQ
jgi:diguanylate cyclase (GGDEF)-like protein/PAS domain S-box-containing protein